MEKKPRIYFLGSGAISVPVLEKLAGSEKLLLVGAGTQPDKPAGRKRHLHPTPAASWADAHNLGIARWDSINTPEALDAIRATRPDMILVISFGQILRRPVLELPPLGCINIHASLLPKYRGASPIASSIIEGEQYTGISYMRMEAGLDTGPVYCAFQERIGAKTTAEELERNLGALAARTLEDVLIGIADGTLESEKQDPARVSFTGKIKKADGQVNWNEPACRIERRIRAYHQWPGMSFQLETGTKSMHIKISEAEVLHEIFASPGKILEADNKDFIISCRHGALRLLRVIPEGKREMSGADFIRGLHVNEKHLSLSLTLAHNTEH